MLRSEDNENTRSTARGLLILAAIILFARIYYVIYQNRHFRKNVILHHEAAWTLQDVEIAEMPLFFSMFILVLAGMPLLR